MLIYGYICKNKNKQFLYKLFKKSKKVFRIINKLEVLIIHFSFNSDLVLGINDL